MEDNEFDVVVIGGGAAGLSASLMVGRSMRSVLVVDAGETRNRFAPVAPPTPASGPPATP